MIGRHKRPDRLRGPRGGDPIYGQHTPADLDTQIGNLDMPVLWPPNVSLFDMNVLRIDELEATIGSYTEALAKNRMTTLPAMNKGWR